MPENTDELIDWKGEKMIQFAGTDMHHTNHLNALHELAGRKDFYKLIAEADLLNKTLL